jgi:hypothetical protein
MKATKDIVFEHVVKYTTVTPAHGQPEPRVCSGRYQGKSYSLPPAPDILRALRLALLTKNPALIQRWGKTVLTEVLITRTPKSKTELVGKPHKDAANPTPQIVFTIDGERTLYYGKAATAAKRKRKTRSQLDQQLKKIGICTPGHLWAGDASVDHGVKWGKDGTLTIIFRTPPMDDANVTCDFTSFEWPRVDDVTSALTDLEVTNLSMCAQWKLDTPGFAIVETPGACPNSVKIEKGSSLKDLSKPSDVCVLAAVDISCATAFLLEGRRAPFYTNDSNDAGCAVVSKKFHVLQSDNSHFFGAVVGYTWERHDDPGEGWWDAVRQGTDAEVNVVPCEMFLCVVKHIDAGKELVQPARTYVRASTYHPAHFCLPRQFTKAVEQLFPCLVKRSTSGLRAKYLQAWVSRVNAKTFSWESKYLCRAYESTGLLGDSISTSMETLRESHKAEVEQTAGCSEIVVRIGGNKMDDMHLAVRAKTAWMDANGRVSTENWSKFVVPAKLATFLSQATNEQVQADTLEDNFKRTFKDHFKEMCTSAGCGVDSVMHPWITKNLDSAIAGLFAIVNQLQDGTKEDFFSLRRAGEDIGAKPDHQLNIITALARLADLAVTRACIDVTFKHPPMYVPKFILPADEKLFDAWANETLEGMYGRLHVQSDVFLETVATEVEEWKKAFHGTALMSSHAFALSQVNRTIELGMRVFNMKQLLGPSGLGMAHFDITKHLNVDQHKALPQWTSARRYVEFEAKVSQFLLAKDPRAPLPSALQLREGDSIYLAQTNSLFVNSGIQGTTEIDLALFGDFAFTATATRPKPEELKRAFLQVYPIHEPASGGYFYTGSHKLKEHTVHAAGLGDLITFVCTTIPFREHVHIRLQRYEYSHARATAGLRCNDMHTGTQAVSNVLEAVDDTSGLLHAIDLVHAGKEPTKKAVDARMLAAGQWAKSLQMGHEGVEQLHRIDYDNSVYTSPIHPADQPVATESERGVWKEWREAAQELVNKGLDPEQVNVTAEDKLAICKWVGTIPRVYWEETHGGFWNIRLSACGFAQTTESENWFKSQEDNSKEAKAVLKWRNAVAKCVKCPVRPNSDEQDFCHTMNIGVCYDPEQWEKDAAPFGWDFKLDHAQPLSVQDFHVDCAPTESNLNFTQILTLEHTHALVLENADKGALWSDPKNKFHLWSDLDRKNTVCFDPTKPHAGDPNPVNLPRVNLFLTCGPAPVDLVMTETAWRAQLQGQNKVPKEKKKRKRNSEGTKEKTKKGRGK